MRIKRRKIESTHPLKAHPRLSDEESSAKMKQILQEPGLTRIMQMCLAVSLLLILWQGLAFITGKIPDHIQPLVVLISGSQESIPVAYSWTFKIGFLSIMGLMTATAFLILRRYLLKR